MNSNPSQDQGQQQRQSGQDDNPATPGQQPRRQQPQRGSPSEDTEGDTRPSPDDRHITGNN